ncbi:hypothetical protein [Parasphingorhabdus sp.]|uniref:hypothetical protein n=1 Tax=Parasphingorhabdus sp. TaxID=2709688 RepID=UPI0032639147
MTDTHHENSLVGAFMAQRKNSLVILEQYNFGVYALYFEDSDDGIMTRDDLHDTIDDAKEFCREDYGMVEEDWERIPDHTPIMVTF